jgi:hypothetical protein
MDVGCNRNLSRPLNVEERSNLHVLVTNIRDKKSLDGINTTCLEN